MALKCKKITMGGREDNLGDKRVMNASAKRKMAWFATKVRKQKEQDEAIGYKRRNATKQGNWATGWRITISKAQKWRGNVCHKTSATYRPAKSYNMKLIRLGNWIKVFSLIADKWFPVQRRAEIETLVSGLFYKVRGILEEIVIKKSITCGESLNGSVSGSRKGISRGILRTDDEESEEMPIDDEVDMEDLLIHS